MCVCVCVSEGFKVCRGLKRGRVGVMYGWIGVSAVGDFFLLCLSLGFWIDRVFDPSLGTVRYGVGSGFGFDMSEPWYGMGWDGVGLTLGRGGTGRYIVYVTEVCLMKEGIFSRGTEWGVRVSKSKVSAHST